MKGRQITGFFHGEEDYRQVSKSQLIAHLPPSERSPVSAVRPEVHTMENKPKMGTNGTPVADTTETSVNDVIEAGHSKSNTKLAADSRSLSCAPSVRNFGSVSTLIHGLNSSPDCAVFKDCNIFDASFAAKHFYDRSREYLKCDAVPWDDFVKVQKTNAATSESLPGTSLPSTAGACKFIKDEKEPSVIMDTACPSFDPSAVVSALDTCSDPDRKQHLGLNEGEPTRFPSAAAGSRPGLEVSPNFLIDLNQSDQLVNPLRTESRCALSGKAAINFDANAQTAAQLSMYKTDAPRWQMSPAETQYWGQAAGVGEDPFTSSGYNGMQNQNQTLPQRNPSPFPSFPG